MNRYVLIAVLCSLLGWSAAWGASVEGLYEVQVPVADQSAGERARAFEAALRQVAVRVSGSRAAAQGEALASDAVEPGRVVQQYGYLPTEQGLQMRVLFEPAATQRLLRQRGLPIWSGQRPTTLVWLAVQDGGERRLVGADAPGAAGQALLEQANQRAVPLILPLLDLEDQSQVRFADVWGGFFDNVRTASQRYAADAVLVGRLQRQGGGWLARWTLFDGGETRHWSQSLNDLETAAATGVDALADTLAARSMAQSGAGADRIGVEVYGVRTLEDYAQLANFLDSRDSIRDARLVLVEGDRVRYELDARGGAEGLSRSLRSWERFVPLAAVDPGSGAVAEGAATPALQFRMVP